MMVHSVKGLTLICENTTRIVLTVYSILDFIYHKDKSMNCTIIGLIYVVTLHQEGQKWTFRVINLDLFVELVWKLGKIYVVAFTQKGQKCTLRLTNWHLVMDLECN